MLSSRMKTTVLQNYIWVPLLLSTAAAGSLFFEISYVIQGLLLFSGLASGFILLKRHKAGGIKTVAGVCAVLAGFGLILLLLVRVEYYAGPQFVLSTDGDMVFYQEIAVSKAYAPQRELQYPWNRLPETAAFRTAQLREEQPGITDEQIDAALARYPFPSRVVRRSGQGLPEGDAMLFIMSLQKARYSEEDDQYSQYYDLRERGLVAYCNELLQHFIDMYERFLVEAGYRLDRSGQSGYVAVYPESPPYNTRARAHAAGLGFLLAGWLLFAKMLSGRE